MKSSKKNKKKEDNEPKPHLTRKYVQNELINEIDIPIGDLDDVVTRVFEEKERIYTVEFVLKDIVKFISGRIVSAITSPVTLSVKGVIKLVGKGAYHIFGKKEISSMCDSAIKATTKKQLEKVFKNAKNGIRVKTYYSGCWEEDCYCSHSFSCYLACAEDFYGGSYVVYEAY